MLETELQITPLEMSRKATKSFGRPNFVDSAVNKVVEAEDFTSIFNVLVNNQAGRIKTWIGRNEIFLVSMSNPYEKFNFDLNRVEDSLNQKRYKAPDFESEDDVERWLDSL